MPNELKTFKKQAKLMGNAFEITVLTKDEAWAFEKIDIAIQEIKRIESLLTTYHESSQTNLINQAAGEKAVKVDKEVFNLIQRANKISQLTDGAFDLSYGSIDKKFWNFDVKMSELPDAKTAKENVKLINFKNILLNEKELTVMLKEKGMRIGFGGIGKGYAADKAKQILQKEGVESGIVNASGDLTTWGYQANNKAWTVGIANPDQKNTPFSYLNITNMAMATSGNYEKYVMIAGEKYSHTINPKTGFPIKGIKSVTVISPNAEICDAMATPISVMGIKAGLNLINQLHQVECIIIDDHNKIYCSNNIRLK